MAEHDWKSIEIFEKKFSGRLMKIEENEQTRYQFLIWFEYTRQSMMRLKEGTLLAAINFATTDKETHYSILELTAIKPIHYALGEKIDGYPGFVMEAARSIVTDWRNQEDTSHEDTTIIQCIASPTEHEIIESESDRLFKPGYSIPMIGAEVKILSSPATEKAVNKGLSNDPSAFICGKSLVDVKIPIFISAEELLRVHFGIFGFTKAGKSNLLSTLTSEIFQISEKKKFPVKIVLFDLMSEYSILLIDQIDKINNSRIIGIGEQTFPQSLIDYLKNPADEGKKISAIKPFLNTSLFPKDLLPYKNDFGLFVKDILTKKKIQLYVNVQNETINQLVNQNLESLTGGHSSNYDTYIKRFIANLQQIGDTILTSQVIDTIINNTRTLLTTTPPPRSSSINPNATLISTSDHRSNTSIPNYNKEYLQGIDFTIKITDSAKAKLIEFISNLEKKKSQIENRTNFPESSRININQIINELNDESFSSLIVIQSHDPHALRDFAHELGTNLYESRRRAGSISPIVSFIFDEADEFIPQNPSQGSSYARSNDIAHMLARRGRKFGLGIGIATQRITYLNTSILAQPHTYFVSKLPRSSDRDRIKEAFGFSDEMLKQAIKFTIGDWIVASYDATGMTGMPIPIHTDDANERLIESLRKKKEQIQEHIRE